MGLLQELPPPLRVSGEAGHNHHTPWGGQQPLPPAILLLDKGKVVCFFHFMRQSPTSAAAPGPSSQSPTLHQSTSPVNTAHCPPWLLRGGRQGSPSTSWVLISDGTGPIRRAHKAMGLGHIYPPDTPCQTHPTPGPGSHWPLSPRPSAQCSTTTGCLSSTAGPSDPMTCHLHSSTCLWHLPPHPDSYQSQHEAAQTSPSPHLSDHLHLSPSWAPSRSEAIPRHGLQLIATLSSLPLLDQPVPHMLMQRTE